MNQIKADPSDIKEQITYCVLNAISGETDPSDEKLREIISDVISENPSYKMNLDQKREMAQMVFNSLRRLDVIEPLMEDPSITEIMVNGPYKIFFERGGKLYKSNLTFRDEESLKTCISCFFANQNRPLNEANPIADLRLPDGSRANAVLPPISTETTVTIRKFTGITHDIVSLIRQEFISEEAARFLAECVRNKRTIFICGGTGSGKTTFLNSLSNFIPKNERIVTIEDSAELKLQGIDNLVQMEGRLAGPDGTGEVNIGMMIRASLRMRPDRIIVGEVRGKESADLLNCLTSGHPGSMSTGHSNSCFEMMERLTAMIMSGSSLPYDAILSQVSMGINIVLHIMRSREGKRYIDEICEVLPPQDHEYRLKTLYRNKGGDRLERIASIEDIQRAMAYRA